MNELKLIETNGKTLLFIEMPKWARAFEIVTNQDHPYNKQVQFEADLFWGLQNYDYVNLPPGNWQILGKSTELSVAQMKEICPIYEWGGYKIHNERPDLLTKDVTESYLSLLEANGIVDRNKYGNNEPSNVNYYNQCELPDYIFQEDLRVWQEAQSKVKHYLVLEKI